MQLEYPDQQEVIGVGSIDLSGEGWEDEFCPTAGLGGSMRLPTLCPRFPTLVVTDSMAWLLPPFPRYILASCPRRAGRQLGPTRAGVLRVS